MEIIQTLVPSAYNQGSEGFLNTKYDFIKQVNYNVTCGIYFFEVLRHFLLFFLYFIRV